MLQSFPVKQTTSITHTPKCRLWICDVSGSMTRHIAGMADDLAMQLNNCDPQDLLTVLWFSSQGLRGSIVKGATIGTMRSQIEAAIRKQMYARNLTCFSESLFDAKQVIDDLSAFNYPWSVMLYSDGYPVVMDYAREIQAIFTAIKQLKGSIADATIVGYGDYYNRELLAQMAAGIGGTLVHADDLTEFSRSMTTHLGTPSATRISVMVKGATGIYGLATGKVVTYPVENEIALVSPLEPCVYAYTHNALAKKSTVTTEQLAPLYAAALLAGQNNQVDVALEILGTMGDVALVNRLASAFTNTEIGITLSAVEAAVFLDSQRFKEGRKPNCLPKHDAFCLIEALEVLEQDTQARFHPDAGFVYKLTGVASKTKDGYSEFVRVANQAVPISLTWHGSRMNVSLRAEYDGSITLPSTPSNLPLILPCKQYRNYVIIKDGTLNVKQLPISMSRNTFYTLVGGKLIGKDATWAESKVFQLDLTRIPVMNRAMADGINAATLAQSALDELQLEAKQKVLRWRRSILDPDKTEVVSQYTPEQVEFLKTIGVDYLGRYNPPTVEADATDWYDAKTFELKIKGASSLPKIDDVLLRKQAGKTLNLAQQAVDTAYQWYQAQITKTVLDELASVDAALREVKLQLLTKRSVMQRAKAAVVLGNRWFPEFKSRAIADSVWNVAGTEVTFALGTEKIAY